MKAASLCAIFLLILFPSIVFSQRSKTEILNIFHKYVALNNDFINSAPENSPTHDSYNDLRRAVEAYAEDVYNPILKDAKSIICNNGDQKLLSEYFQVIIRTRNSADEYPTFILGDIFICRSKLVIAEFKKLSKEEKMVIYDAVEWGFKNATWKKENSIPNYSSLNEKLLSLKQDIK